MIQKKNEEKENNPFNQKDAAQQEQVDLRMAEESLDYSDNITI